MEACKREFKLKNCGLDLDPDSVDAMVRSEWQSKSKSVYYLIYRWAVAVFVVLVVTLSMNARLRIISFGIFFINFTCWGMLLNMIVGVMGAILVTFWSFHADFKDNVVRKKKMPTMFKVYWALHNTALIISIIVTIVYWTLIYKDDKQLDAVNILTHIANSAIMFLDVLIVAHPLRLYHVVQPIFFSFIYALFSFIYHLCGGVNWKGKPYIYGVLDWAYPERALTFIFGVVIAMIIAQIFLFMVSQLRMFVQQQYSTKKLNTDEVGVNQTFIG